MRRRDFIRLSGTACVATLVAAPGCARVPEPSAALVEPSTLGTFADEDTIREIGEAYLAAVPEERRQRRLVRALLEDEGALADQVDSEALTRFLRTRIRSDFEAGRTVLVDGWVLSVTEARQAALFSMVS